MDKVTAGVRARAILEDEVFLGMWDRLRDDYRARMEYPSQSDDDVLEARRALLALHRVRKDFENLVTDGENEAKKRKGGT